MQNFFKTTKCLLILFIFITILLKTPIYAKDIKIAFLTTSLSYRGTDIALFDYAHFNETILGNTSYIFSTKDHRPVKQKYLNRFGERCFFGHTMEDLEAVIEKEKIKIVYIIKSGEKDPFLFKNAKNAIHVVFYPTQPHGEVYAVISNWINKNFSSNFPVVPHMIHVDESNESLRKELSIPENALVFGRHGGYDTFDISFVHRAIIDTVLTHENIYFCFLNTAPFFTHERIIYLPATTDLKYKTKFINTCDAMIHARSDGETFGLACGEFSVKNKPILTMKCGALAHIEILKDTAIYYSCYDDLYHIFNTFYPNPNQDYNMYKDYTPEKIMKIFEEVFIND